ncbi:unnamed protein product, partial [Amoebophrya sp. A25]
TATRRDRVSLHLHVCDDNLGPLLLDPLIDYPTTWVTLVLEKRRVVVS